MTGEEEEKGDLEREGNEDKNAARKKNIINNLKNCRMKSEVKEGRGKGRRELDDGR